MSRLTSTATAGAAASSHQHHPQLDLGLQLHQAREAAAHSRHTAESYTFEQQQQESYRLYNNTPSTPGGLSIASLEQTHTPLRKKHDRVNAQQRPEMNTPAKRQTVTQPDTNARLSHSKRPRSPPILSELDPAAAGASSSGRSQRSANESITHADGSFSIASSQRGTDTEEDEPEATPAKLQKVIDERSLTPFPGLRNSLASDVEMAIETRASFQQVPAREFKRIIHFLECSSIVGLYRCNRTLRAAVDAVSSFAETHDSVKLVIPSIAAVKSVNQSLVSRFCLHVVWRPSSTAGAPLEYLTAFRDRTRIDELEIGDVFGHGLDPQEAAKRSQTQWNMVMTHPILHNHLRILSTGAFIPSSITSLSAPLVQMKQLQKLIIPARSVEDKLSNLHSLPKLTSLEVSDAHRPLQSCLESIRKCQHLRSLSLISPQA
jgi:hypothetical protein